MQLPHIGEEESEILRSTFERGTTLYKYCMMNAIERKALVYNIFRGDQQKFNEHEKCIEALPLAKLSMSAEVIGGNSEICVGDFLTVKIRVDQVNLKKGEQSGYVHSKQYPYLRRDSWYLIITEETMTGLACCEKIDIEEEFYEKEFKERMMRPGPIKFVVILTNDSYKGLDVIKKHECMVTAKSAFRREYQYL